MTSHRDTEAQRKSDPLCVSVPLWLVITGLWLVRRDVVQGKRTQSTIGQPKRGRFGAGTVRVPPVDLHPLDHPHRGGPVAAGAMDKCRVVAGVRDRLQKTVHDGR